MAFKVASQKAQAALRRILPSYLSDYKEDLTNEQKLSNLSKAYGRLLGHNKILRMAKNQQQAFEYAQNLESLTALYQEIHEVKQALKKEKQEKHLARQEKQMIEAEIHRKKKTALHSRRDRFALDVIKEMGLIDRDTWIKIGAEAEKRMNTFLDTHPEDLG